MRKNALDSGPNINMDLAVNEGKTKYMLLASGYMKPICSQITADIFKEFIYFASAVTTKNNVSLGIKRRIILVNRCYYCLNGQLSSTDFSRMTKLIHYATLILPYFFMLQ